MSSCVPCPPNTYDGDDDPTTPCSAAAFRTSTLWDPAYLKIRANYTVNETFSVGAVVAALNSGTERDDLTLADMFVGVSDAEGSDVDGVDGIRFELNMQVANHVSHSSIHQFLCAFTLLLPLIHVCACMWLLIGTHIHALFMLTYAARNRYVIDSGGQFAVLPTFNATVFIDR